MTLPYPPCVSLRRRIGWILRNLPEVLSVVLVRIYRIDTRAFNRGTSPDFASQTYNWLKANAFHINLLAADTEVRDSLGLDNVPQGKRLYVAVKGNTGQVVAYIGCQMRTKRMGIRKEFVLTDEECFIAPYFTKQAWRGRGCVTHGIRFVLQQMAEAGRPVAYIDIATRNRASNRVIEKLGGEVLDSWYIIVRICKRDHIIPWGPLRSRFRRLQEDW